MKRKHYFSINNLFKQEIDITCCLDNNQSSFLIRFQRKGTCSNLLKVTAIAIKQCLVDDENDVQHVETVDIKCLKQVTLSLPKMIFYETITSNQKTLTPSSTLLLIHPHHQQLSTK